MTRSEVLSDRATASASSGVPATAPGGVATPNFCISSLAWYSWMFMAECFSERGFSAKGEDACDLEKRTDRFLRHKLRCSHGLESLVVRSVSGGYLFPRAGLCLPQGLQAGADGGDFDEFREAAAQPQSVDEPDQREKRDGCQQVEGND